jgi:predicted nucleotide-binding protein
MSETPYIFVSYARRDSEPVRQVVAELQKRGIKVWIDTANLMAGESWVASIQIALEQANVLLVFISPESTRSKWIIHEFEAAIKRGIAVLPILLRPTPIEQLPPRLREIQWLDMSRFAAETAPVQVAEEIVRILGRKDLSSNKRSPKQATTNLAEALAAQTRDRSVAEGDAKNPPDSIFLVHGHDEPFLREIEQFVRCLGITPIVMKDVGGATTSLIEKFFEIGGAARYAIVLLSGDDMGASRDQYEEPDVGIRALQYRSRQNAVLELGFFYGLLGWENVFVLERMPPRKFPNFERPSDLNGVLFDRYDGTGKWRPELHKRLSNAGFKILPLSQLPIKSA